MSLDSTKPQELCPLISPRGRILAWLVMHGPSTVAEISRPLPISDNSIQQHLRKLIESGVVKRQRIGLGNVYSAIPQKENDHGDYSAIRAIATLLEG